MGHWREERTLGPGHFWVLQSGGAGARRRRDRLERAGVSRVLDRRRFGAERRPRCRDPARGGVRCPERDDPHYTPTSGRRRPTAALARRGPRRRFKPLMKFFREFMGRARRQRTNNRHWTAAIRQRLPTSDLANAPRRSTRASRADMRSPPTFGTGDRPTASTRRFRHLSASPRRETGAARQPIPIQACHSRCPACSTRR